MEFRDRVKELRRVRAGDLAGDPRNWRTHPEGQRSALREVLRSIGFAGAVLARETKYGLSIIDGHLRAGMDLDAVIPVLVTDLTEAEAGQLLAVYDPIAALAGRSEEALDALLAETRRNVEAGLLNEIPCLDEIIAGAMGGTEERQGRNPSGGGLLPDADPDDVPAAGAVESRAETGSLWALGDHRLLCGDATDAADVRRLLGSEQPFLMVTDPPYGVDYDPEWRQREAAAGRLTCADRRVGEVTNDSVHDWTDAWMLSPAAIVYCWHACWHASSIQESLLGCGFEIRAQIIWAKPHLAISRGHYHWQHEPCWYAVRKGKTAQWIGDRSQTTLWAITLDRNVAGGHSTQKPVECMARPLRNHDGDVYDPFLGSGTTLIAAEQLGRRCFGMEIEPRYCDVSLTRWEQATGQTAERIK